MSYEINEKIRNMVPYQSIEGNFSIRLDANESFIRPDERMLREISRAVTEIAFNRYPDPAAKEVCGLFARHYGVPLEYVTAGNGSDELINVLIGSFFQKSQKVLTIEPDFSMYSFYSRLAELDCVTLQKGEAMTVDIDQVIQTVRREKIAGVFFSNPCNPTSIGIGKEEILRLVESVDALVVVDEAYMDFYNQSVLLETGSHENLIVLRTCSKALAAAGIRLGFAVSCPKNTKALRSAKSPYNVNSLTQAVGAVMLSNGEYLRECTQRLIASRARLFDIMKDLNAQKAEILEVYPSDTNFIFMKMRDAAAVKKRLEEESIAVRQLGQYLRITAGKEEENRAVAEALERILI